MRTSSGTSDLKGFLIDLDYAHQIKPNTPNSEQPICVTGTAPFVALELLLGKNVVHTWRHDLESFFHVLIWKCTEDPHFNLSAWVRGLSSKTVAQAKAYQIGDTPTFQELLDDFAPQFESLKSLAWTLREILFHTNDNDKSEFTITTHHSNTARNNMYEDIIKAFDDCIFKLEEAKRHEKSQ